MSKKNEIVIDRKKQFFGLPEKTVGECLHAHFYGLGMLYALITDRDILYDTQRDMYYVWAGHHYKPDYLFHAQGRVEDVACCLGDYYLSLGKQIADSSDDSLKKSLGKRQEQISKYIKSLRSPAGINQCLDMARTNPTVNISVTSDQFDQDLWLLAGPNGVMDLALGERRPGEKSDLCLKHTRVNIPENVLEETSPAWKNFLAESIEDKNIIEFIQRWCGYVLTGEIPDHVVLILSGLLGRNGKTVLIETLKKILGEYAISIQAEMLLDQGRTRSSAGPSPDIMS
ncbi:MAG: hypothetical protein LC660_12190, partial [Desulfobacteraceae bacterium]|nr:hypothetical protein [Desulfobacteraceae bacterium]